MATVQYGMIVTDIKGKVGGQVLQGGNNSKVLRNKGNAGTTRSIALQTATRNLVTNAKAWKALSGANVSAWNSFAPSWPFIDKYGVTYYSTGYQVYIAYNNARLAMGLAAASTPVVSDTYQPLGVITAAYVAGVSLILNWSEAGAALEMMQVFGTDALSPGQNSNNKRWRLVTTFNTSGLITKNITAAVIASYGSIIAGRIYYVKCVIRTQNGPIIQDTQIIKVTT